ncbi:MAG: hypothetical protein AAF624_19235 [Bacteroidota bacterium]
MLAWSRPFLVLLIAFATVPLHAQDADTLDDPYLWLEDVEGERALSWVTKQNAETVAALEAHPAYDDLYGDILDVLNSDDRIAYPGLRGDFVYNFWTDADNPRGLWRRASVDAYLAGDPVWETLLDIDKLGADENVNWVYKGTTCLAPNYDRCLVRLSRGGADAAEVREFDVPSKSFVDGFYVPEAKSSLAWIDADTLLLSTDWGEGSLTESGYPRTVKRWTRGTPLDDAETVYEGATTDVGVWAASVRMGATSVPVIAHRPSFFEGTTYVLRDGTPVALDLPMDADPALVDGQLVVYLRTPWTIGDATYPTGALIATDYEAFLAGERDFETVFVPSERQTVQYVTSTAHSMVASILDNVQGQLHRFRYEDGTWTGTKIDAPALGSVNVVSTSSEDDRFFFVYSSYLQPTTLYLAGEDDAVAEVSTLPALFDAEGLTSPSTRPPPPTAPRSPISSCTARTSSSTAPTRRCSTATAASRSRSRRRTAPRRGRRGSNAAASTWSPTSGAGASLAPPGTAPRRRNTASAPTTTSSRSLRTSSRAASRRPTTSACRAAPTAAS